MAAWDLSSILLLTFFALAFALPCITCFYRYYSPCAPEEYKIQHEKWKEAVKRRKESKKASKLASKELVDARKASRKDSTKSSGMV